MSIGRSVVVPLAYRRLSAASPAVAALTVQVSDEPVTLSRLTNPAPEKLRWLDSTAPWDTAASSASYRLAGGGVLPPALAYADPIQESSIRSRLYRVESLDAAYVLSTSSRTYRVVVAGRSMNCTPRWLVRVPLLTALPQLEPSLEKNTL